MHRQIYIVREAIVIFTDACTLWCFLVFIWLFSLFVVCVRVFYCVCVCVNLQYVNSFPHFARTAWHEQLQIYSIYSKTRLAGHGIHVCTCVSACLCVAAALCARCIQLQYVSAWVNVHLPFHCMYLTPLYSNVIRYVNVTKQTAPYMLGLISSGPTDKVATTITSLFTLLQATSDKALSHGQTVQW